MAGGATSFPTAGNQAAFDPDERRVFERVEDARRRIAMVDLAIGIVALLVGLVGVLLLGAFLDHWLFEGGMPGLLRWGIWTLAVALGAFWIVKAVLPPLVRRVNPLYAAKACEEIRPTLKDALINFLLLRSEREVIERDPIGRHIYHGLAHKAAEEVEHIPPEIVVDRAPLVRLGIVLAALVGLTALYIVVSPKSPFPSFGRVLLPWSSIPAPTRVHIDEVDPGTAQVFMGDRVTVSARVRGRRDDEPVRLRYSTADGQAVNKAMPMQPADDGDVFEVVLFDEIRQDVRYFIECGDARSDVFTLTARPPLSIDLDSIELRYPDYTLESPRRIDHAGDIRALEGTQVTLFVSAGESLLDLRLEPDAPWLSPIRGRVDGAKGTIRFTLKRDPKTAAEAEPSVFGFVLRGHAEDGRANRHPVRYRVEVLPDLAPEITWVDPPADNTPVAVSQELPLRVVAEDLDYALDRVTVHVERQQTTVGSQELLPDEKRPLQGTFEGTFSFVPKAMGLKPGDRVACRAEAADNRRPVANRAQTRSLWFVIVEDAKQASGQDETGDAPREPQSPFEAPRESQPGGGEGNGPVQPNPDSRGSETPSPAETESAGDAPTQGGDAQIGPPSDNGPSGDQQPAGTSDGAQGGTADSQGDAATEAPSPSPESGAGAGERPESTPETAPNEQGDNPQASPPGTQPSEMQNPAAQGETQGGSGGEGEQSGTQAGSQEADPSAAGTAPESRQDGAGTGEPNPSPGNTENGGTSEPSGIEPGDAAERPGEKPTGQNQENAGNTGGPENPTGEQANPASETGAESAADEGSPSGNQDGAGGVPTPQSDAGSGEAAGGSRSAQSGSDSQQADGSDGTQASGQGNEQPGTGSKPSRPGGRSRPREKPVDGTTDPGEVFQQVLEFMWQGKKEAGREGVEESPSSPEGLEKDRPKGSGDTGDSVRPDRKPGRPQGGGSTTGADAPSRPTGGMRPKSSGESGAGSHADPNQGAGNIPRTARGTAAHSEGSHTSQLPDSPTTDHRDDESTGDEPPPTANPSADPNRSKPSTQERSDTAGFESGEGSQGGGQQSTKPGLGNPGSNMPTESGGNPQRGPGSERTPEPGSETAAGPQGNVQQPGGGNTGSGGDSHSGGSRMIEAPPEAATDAMGLGGGANHGRPTGIPPQSPRAYGRETATDDPILEYAKQQSDLALEYLEDRMKKGEVDQELLDRLGWTEADLAEFVRRWQAMRRAAETAADDTQARRYREILKSLGLRPQQTSIESDTADDALRGMHSGSQTAPPAGWDDAFRAYLKSLGRVQ
ncbi:circumsporozoite protein- membrane associated protein [Thermostilla marina]